MRHLNFYLKSPTVRLALDLSVSLGSAGERIDLIQLPARTNWHWPFNLLLSEPGPPLPSHLSSLLYSFHHYFLMEQTLDKNVTQSWYNHDTFDSVDSNEMQLIKPQQKSIAKSLLRQPVFVSSPNKALLCHRIAQNTWEVLSGITHMLVWSWISALSLFLGYFLLSHCPRCGNNVTCQVPPMTTLCTSIPNSSCFFSYTPSFTSSTVCTGENIHRHRTHPASSRPQQGPGHVAMCQLPAYLCPDGVCLLLFPQDSWRLERNLTNSSVKG